MAEHGSSPYINHFIQPDTIIPNPADPQSWNRYSYVQNNPIRYTDPTGHVTETPNDLADFFCSDPKYCKEGDFKLDPYILRNKNNNIPDQSLDDIVSGDDDEINQNPTISPDPFIMEMQFFSAAGDLAGGGLLFGLSLLAIGESCALAFPACLITAPIFFTTAVIGAQSFYNGFETIRSGLDPNVKPPTGREIIDFVFPFLKKE